MSDYVFESTTSVHGLPAIELVGLDKPHEFLRRAVMVNGVDDPFYVEKCAVSPFLQGQDKDWTLVEFWGPADKVPQYIAWLNAKYTQFLVEFSQR